jgi:hypothetical protein
MRLLMKLKRARIESGNMLPDGVMTTGRAFRIEERGYLAAIRRFPNSELVIRRLISQSETFRAIKISVSRGAGFLITRQGPFANAQLTFDGKVISLYGKDLNVYAQLDSPGPSFEEATEEFRTATGLDAAGADLLAADPYPLLTEDVVQGIHVGEAYIDGEKCDHLAFRNESVDWQIWISTGEQKLPVKYVITTKWVTGAPQYSLRLKNWDTGKVDAKLFAFKPPADAKKLEELRADEVGDLHLEGKQ